MLLKSLTLFSIILLCYSCTKSDNPPTPEQPEGKIAEYDQIQGSAKLYYNGDTLIKAEQLINNPYTNELEYTYIIDYLYTDGKLTGFNKYYKPVNAAATLEDEVSFRFDSNGFIKQSIVKNKPDTTFWTTNAKGEILGYRTKTFPVHKWEINNEGNVIPLTYTEQIAGQQHEVKREMTYNNKPNPFYKNGLGRMMLITFQYPAGDLFILLSKNLVTRYKGESTLSGPGENAVQLTKTLADYTYEYDEKGLMKSYQEKYKNEEFYNGTPTSSFSGDPVFKIKWHPN